MKMARQRGCLRNIHTRIPEKDYQQISEICKKLDITFADYFNQIIHADGYKKLQIYAEQIKKEPRNCNVEMSAQTKESIDQLSLVLNSQSMQLRRIGANLSNLILKLYCADTALDGDAISSMKKDLDTVLKDVHKASSRLADILYDDTAIAKIQYIGHDIWED